MSLGIGDDAAIVALRDRSRELVWTVDSFVEGVHFRPDLMTWEDVGWRSFMTAASDLAAMASEPVGALSAIVLPVSFADDDLLAIGRGQRRAAEAIGTAVVGGNLSTGTEVSITTTVLGSVRHAVRRDGAKPGHLVALCGSVGLASAGLRLLLREPGLRAGNDDEAAAIQAFRAPVARIAHGLACAGVASSLIDVSDGLAQDAGHVAEASGVRIDLELGVIVDARLGRLGGRLSCEAEELALHGGDDYALLGTFSDYAVPEGFVVVGRCVEGEGVWSGGKRIEESGHEHFRAR